MRSKVLIIDDEKSICEVLGFALKTKYIVDYAVDPYEGMAKLRDNDFDVVLLDLRLGSVSGLDILKEVRSVSLRSAVIMMTAYGSEQVSVEAMKLGAFSYLTKPLDMEALKVLVAKAVEHVKMADEISYLSEELKGKNSEEIIVGQNPKMRKVFSLVDRVKNVDSNVLITGESGTGKELIARRIHEKGLRKNNRFVTVNCAAIPENLLESEFFGYKKGSFTGATTDRKGKFALADKGTLFLDEIGEMPVYLQAKLLRVLQEKAIVPVGGWEEQKVDVRIVAATNRDLKQMVKDGTFREDLYYRLNVMEIHIPPLRERREDIPAFCDYFIKKFNREQKKSVKGLSESAKKLLMEYDYPGNIRQLANIVERAMIITTGEYISPLALILDTRANVSAEEPKDVEESLLDLLEGKSLKEIECLAIEAALRASGGKKAIAARSLGISERGLWYKIKEYGL